MWKYEPVASVWTLIASTSAEQPLGRYGRPQKQIGRGDIFALIFTHFV
jgi:hypothetical protein